MPVQYEGVLSEHDAVRGGVGLFDVSHLGRFEVIGSGATELLRSQLCNDIERIGPGRAQYTMALNPSLLLVISTIASETLAAGETLGISSSVCITSLM